MLYSVPIFLLLLAMQCVAADQVAESEFLANLLSQRFPGYVKSMPTVVEDVNQVPFKWVGKIHSLDKECSKAPCTFYVTGCAFQHPKVVLTAAHAFFDENGNLLKHDYYWVPRSNQKIILGKMQSSRIRKVVIHDTISGFSRSRMDFDEDIACAIVYDDNPEFAIGYESQEAVEAALSDRTKIIAGYFKVNSIYGFSELHSDNISWKMRATVPTSRNFKKLSNRQNTYISSGGKLSDLQLPNQKPIFLMTAGCSGSPVFVQDIDESWKVAMVYVGQYPHAFTDFKYSIDAFLNNVIPASLLPTTYIFGRLLSRSFYEKVFADILKIVDDQEMDGERTITWE